MRLSVTAADIEEGCRGTQGNCAIVVSIMRSIPDAILVKANQDVIRYTVRAERRQYIYPAPPPIVVEYLRAYDHHQRVEPFEFEIGEPTLLPIGTSGSQSRSRRSRKRLAGVPTPRTWEATA